jgi:hypothetical protein
VGSEPSEVGESRGRAVGAQARRACTDVGEGLSPEFLGSLSTPSVWVMTRRPEADSNCVVACRLRIATRRSVFASYWEEFPGEE